MTESLNAEGQENLKSIDGDEKQEIPRRFPRILLYGSTILTLFVFLVYFFQFDQLAGLTIAPAFIWVVPPLCLTILLRPRNRPILWSVHLFVWGSFLVFCVPEVPGLLRSVSRRTEITKEKEADVIRVISFNAAASTGDLQLLAEYQPDILLVQECPPKARLEELGNVLFVADYVIEYINDAAIVAKGKRFAHYDYGSRNSRFLYYNNFSRTTVELVNGRRVELISCRLDPPVVRFDFWSPEYWAEHNELRTSHRGDLEMFYFGTSSVENPPEYPAIMGGDFNAPARDGCTSSLRPELRDAFEDSGIGHGNTGTNHMPIHRVDQIWVSQEFAVQRSFSVPAVHSDHRFVVADLKWKG